MNDSCRPPLGFKRELKETQGLVLHFLLLKYVEKCLRNGHLNFDARDSLEKTIF